MKSTNKTIVLAFIITILLIIGISFMPKEKLNDKIKIGVANDISGMVIDYMIKNKRLNNADIHEDFESYTMNDC
ncbi:hypothetical protein LGL55_04475 [Clostridium tagluense]|nr:hypothetical protein [Clostridium tagluense]MCB2310377.1 hypothetical protein [Clostridium tagluense]MCB2314981.1 hypothetical protein [Clostridium tagluense]MCB2320078.1 hypothetical protein [Clostridium tagluense]MCB2324724.1 hypothetical protein [Clostridium tagluense]MCB2329822.1 hypothetical protein [Clostridium tagluense]